MEEMEGNCRISGQRTRGVRLFCPDPRKNRKASTHHFPTCSGGTGAYFGDEPMPLPTLRLKKGSWTDSLTNQILVSSFYFPFFKLLQSSVFMVNDLFYK